MSILDNSKTTTFGTLKGWGSGICGGFNIIEIVENQLVSKFSLIFARILLSNLLT